MTENPFRQVLAFDILRGVKLIQTTLSVNVWILQIRKRWNRRKQLSFVLAKVQHTRINIMSVLSLTQYDSKGLCLIKRSYDEKVTDYCLKIPEIFFSVFLFHFHYPNGQIQNGQTQKMFTISVRNVYRC